MWGMSQDIFQIQCEEDNLKGEQIEYERRMALELGKLGICKEIHCILLCFNAEFHLFT